MARVLALTMTLALIVTFLVPLLFKAAGTETPYMVAGGVAAAIVFSICVLHGKEQRERRGRALQVLVTVLFISVAMGLGTLFYVQSIQDWGLDTVLPWYSDEAATYMAMCFPFVFAILGAVSVAKSDMRVAGMPTSVVLLLLTIGAGLSRYHSVASEAREGR
ncbi:hypothetical protein M8745_19660, partial [Lutimaribacter sp. EGI FJ00014]|nr:hypothetical protein [Lutimaribacter sp. EGI FJ00014]